MYIFINLFPPLSFSLKRFFSLILTIVNGNIKREIERGASFMATNTKQKSFTFQFEVQKIIYTNAKTKFMILLTKIQKFPEELNIPREMVVQGIIPVA